MENLPEIYHALSRKVLKFVLKRNGGDLETAEAVLQDTFIAAFRSYKAFRHKSSYFTWLCKISLNKLTDYYRNEVHRKSKFVIPSLNQLNSVFDPGLTPEEKLSLDELRNSVNSCLDLLPPEYRQLLHLKYYQDLTGREICLKMNLTPRQLEGKLYRARHTLAKVMDSLHPDIKP
jgi:RNA polymerase sigma-70 factor (ECF subfamily)